MSRDAFGPNLRRFRMQRQISLETIADSTKIAINLLAGLECNDLSDWPEGLMARAYVRQYAIAIGADPDATVDEFCRWFLEGDRRAERRLREHAGIIGHELDWTDEPPAGTDDRRHPVSTAAATVNTSRSPVSAFFIRVRRGFHKA
jgi:transcriptional regulator with XRE-family HTH domain